jgi:Domain of unknown function (DUF4760)
LGPFFFGGEMAAKSEVLVKMRNTLSIVSLLFAFAAFVVMIVFACQGGAFFTPMSGWLLMPATVLIILAFVDPILAVAKTGFVGIKEVSVASGALVVFAGVVIYLLYFCFASATIAAGASLPASSALEKLLNVPPILVAIWAATIGWYVSFQAGAKNQRTANSFALSMQTKTNTELVNATILGRTHFPTSAPITEDDAPLFAMDYAGKMALDLKDLESKVPADQDAISAKRRLLARADAVNAMKTLLNYYEFMAAALEKNDLDEDMLYRTISPQVVGVYKRSAVYIKHMKTEQAQVFCQLTKLVGAWGARLAQDELAAREASSR